MAYTNNTRQQMSSTPVYYAQTQSYAAPQNYAQQQSYAPQQGYAQQQSYNTGYNAPSYNTGYNSGGYMVPTYNTGGYGNPVYPTNSNSNQNANPFGFGTVAENGGVAHKWTDKNAEIQRTMNVINNRLQSGMDITNQKAHYKSLTGQDYTAPAQSMGYGGGYSQSYNPMTSMSGGYSGGYGGYSGGYGGYNGGYGGYGGSSIENGYLTEEQVQGILDQQGQTFQQQQQEQEQYWNNLLQELQGSQNEKEESSSKYDEMFTKLQAQYDELLKQLEYYQMLQQYYNQNGQAGATGSAYNPFM